MSLGALPLPEEGDERLGIWPPGLESNQITTRFPNVTLERAIEGIHSLSELLPNLRATGIHQPVGLRFGVDQGDKSQVGQLPLALIVQLERHHVMPPGQPLQRRPQTGGKKIRNQEYDRTPPQNRIGKP